MCANTRKARSDCCRQSCYSPYIPNVGEVATRRSVMFSISSFCGKLIISILHDCSISSYDHLPCSRAKGCTLKGNDTVVDRTHFQYKNSCVKGELVLFTNKIADYHLRTGYISGFPVFIGRLGQITNESELIRLPSTDGFHQAERVFKAIELGFVDLSHSMIDFSISIVRCLHVRQLTM